MSLFDASIDARTVSSGGKQVPLREWLADVLGEQPGLAELTDAAPLFTCATPAKLEQAAKWLRVAAALKSEGFDPEAWLRVLMRATSNAWAPHVYQPSDLVLAEALLAVDRETALLAAEDFLGIEEPNAGQARKAELAVRALARHGEPPAKYDDLILLKLETVMSREVLEAIPPERRAACFHRLLGEPSNRADAIYRAREAMGFLDLMDDSTQILLRSRIDAIAQMPDDGDDEDPVSELLERIDRGYVPAEDQTPGEGGLTPNVRDALQYWIGRHAEARLADGLGPLAESRIDLAIVVPVAELADLDAWSGATEARRLEIAHSVERAVGEFALRFVELKEYVDIPIAVFEHVDTKMRLSLIPGGCYRRGFSKREEALVVAAGEGDPDAGNWYETYEMLIDQAPSMRPVHDVSVGAVLVFQQASDPREPADVAVMLEQLPFRLLTEAEHEWAMRAGHTSQLTWRGDDVPDEAWIEELLDAGDRIRNRFGLCGLGLWPEVLADVWVSDYEAAPADGTARTGDGPRVVRGGAERYYPWQACGEWHLLTNAMRTSSADWEYFLSLRPALGLLVGDS